MPRSHLDGPADPGAIDLTGDETFARAKQAMAASRAELERSQGIFEQTRQLVEERRKPGPDSNGASHVPDGPPGPDVPAS